MKARADHVSDRPRQTTIFDRDVSSKIEQLLARCDAIKRGTSISRPTTFNREGQAHAEAVAKKEASRG